MLRADNVVCGTSSTGAGTLTLAACPAPPGGLDFDKWLKATGFNFVSTNAVLVSYTIIEYTSAALTTAKQTEKGIGTLTLGASITAATLARTTVQSTVTGLDTSTPSPSFSAPTAITIGTAANTEVHVGASALDIPAFAPYQDTALAANGFLPMIGLFSQSAGAASLSSGQDRYVNFIWPYPMLVKRAYINVQATYTGQNNNLYVRLYAVGANGRPGKLLYDFGQIGTLNASFAATGMISTGAAGSGFLMTPGDYFIDICPIWTAGGTGTPTILQWGTGNGPISTMRMGTVNQQGASEAFANSGSAVAPDPANLTSYGYQSASVCSWFAFGAS